MQTLRALETFKAVGGFAIFLNVTMTNFATTWVHALSN